jgi:hypothetical protein
LHDNDDDDDGVFVVVVVVPENFWVDCVVVVPWE